MKAPIILPLLKQISSLDEDEALSACTERLKSKIQTSIFTPNSEIVYRAARSTKLKHLLLSADILFPDGSGVYMAMKALGSSSGQRTSGIALAEKLLTISAQKGYRIFLLGAHSEIVQKAAEKLGAEYQGINICGYHHGYFDKDGKENEKVIEMINSSMADILFVCLGFPTQEKWISDNLSKLNTVSLAIGLGGSLDVWSGSVKRAPSTMSRLGREWLWRTVSDPKRLPRTLNIAFFSFFTLKELLFYSKKQYKCYEIDNFSK